MDKEDISQFRMYVETTTNYFGMYTGTVYRSTKSNIRKLFQCRFMCEI